jgi:hypothetical protein
MSDRLADDDRAWTWRSIFDAVVGTAMLFFGFIGIGATDVTGAGSQAYWSLMVVAFGLAALAMEWIHEDAAFHWRRSTLRMLAHWLGVLVAVQLVYLFVTEGRVATSDIGLVNGALIALGTFLCGVHTDWRLAAVGAGLAFATVAVAYLERYMWLLFALVVVGLIVALAIAHFRGRRAPPETGRGRADGQNL